MPALFLYYNVHNALYFSFYYDLKKLHFEPISDILDFEFGKKYGIHWTHPGKKMITCFIVD